MRIGIQNYQSIISGEIVLEPGITVLVGDTNSGKTACLRALESAIYNLPGVGFIRSGEVSSVVEIDTDFRYRWVRSSGKDRTVCELDGEVYSKLGLSQNDDISERLGMRAIDVDGDRVRVNFWKQQAPPFLTDKTASAAYKVLTFSNESDIIIELVREYGSNILDCKRSVDRLSGQVDILEVGVRDGEEYLRDNLGIRECAGEVIKVSSDVEDLVSRYDMLTDYRDKVVELECLGKEVSEKEVPDINLEGILEVSRGLVDMVGNLSSYDSVVRDIEDLVGLELDIEFFTKLFRLGDELFEGIELIRGYDELVSLLGELDKDVESLRLDCEGLDADKVFILKEMGVCPLCGSVVL